MSVGFSSQTLFLGEAVYACGAVRGGSSPRQSTGVGAGPGVLIPQGLDGGGTGPWSLAADGADAAGLTKPADSRRMKGLCKVSLL